MLLSAARRRLLIATWVLPAGLLLLRPPPVSATDLQPATVKAFERYVQATEAHRQESRPGDFFYFQTLPQARQREILAAAQRGEIPVLPVETLGASGRSFPVSNGMINHWLGVMLIPHATIPQVFAVLQDYGHYQDIYRPQMVRSRLIGRQDDDFQVFVRVAEKTPWVTPVLNINLDVRYTLPDSSRALVDSRSTRIAQVENAGQPGEHEDSVGHDGGYMWRYNSYWRLEQRPEGVVAEWESIVLSRQIPFLLRWLVRPFINRLARETATSLMSTTRTAVEKSTATGAHAAGARRGNP